MQTMFWLDAVRLTGFNTSLRTISFTRPALDAGICNLISLLFWFCIAHRIIIAVNRAYTKIKILYLGIANDEDDTDAAGITGIDVDKIRLFLKYYVLPMHLNTIWHRPGYGRQSYPICPVHYVQSRNLFFSYEFGY